MARVSPKHLAYRTKAEIVRDLTRVLNADLHYGTKLAVVNNIAWLWTEFDGKRKGCRHWSALAIAERQADRKAKVRHEHVVPRAVIRQMLFGLKPATEEQVRDLCQRFLIGVVVTLAEDRLLNKEFGKSMPEEFFVEGSPSYHDPWLRYKRLPEIEVVHRGCECGKLG